MASFRVGLAHWCGKTNHPLKRVWKQFHRWIVYHFKVLTVQIIKQTDVPEARADMIQWIQSQEGIYVWEHGVGVLYSSHFTLLCQKEAILSASSSKQMILNETVHLSYGENQCKSNDFRPWYLQIKWQGMNALLLVGSWDTLDMKGKKVQGAERHTFNKFQDQSENHHHNKKRQRKKTAKSIMNYVASGPEECWGGVVAAWWNF